MLFLDHASTSRISDSVLDAIVPYLQNNYGNPSSIHRAGRDAMAGIVRAKEQVADLLSCDQDEIYFTSGGTEANNWVIRSATLDVGSMVPHIIASSIEHHSVLRTLEDLEERGECQYTLLSVDVDGMIDLGQLEESFQFNTVLVSLILANNEIGVIEPVKKACEIAHNRGALFHTDAVQAVGHIPVNVRDIGADYLTMSAHKFHGLKGTGALYMKNGSELSPMITGGMQQGGLRAGTDNVLGIVAMGAAAQNAKVAVNNTYKITQLRDELMFGVQKLADNCCVTGSLTQRLPHIASLVFKDIDGENLVLMLDSYGICASSASACSAGSSIPSHVLRAIGVDKDWIRGSLRLSLSEETTEDDVKYVLEKFPAVLASLKAPRL